MLGPGFPRSRWTWDLGAGLHRGRCGVAHDRGEGAGRSPLRSASGATIRTNHTWGGPSCAILEVWGPMLGPGFPRSRWTWDLGAGLHRGQCGTAHDQDAGHVRAWTFEMPVPTGTIDNVEFQNPPESVQASTTAQGGAVPIPRSPNGDRPTDRPTGDRPSADVSSGDRPGADRSSGDRLGGDGPGGGQSNGGQTGRGRPDGGQPNGGRRRGGLSEGIAALQRAGLWDQVIDEIDGRRIRIGDRWLIDFASCNYLGLDLDPHVIEVIDEQVRRWGTHPSWSRMLGSPRLYPMIEERLTELLGAPDVLVLPTITQIHLSVIPALAGATCPARSFWTRGRTRRSTTAASMHAGWARPSSGSGPTTSSISRSCCARATGPRRGWCAWTGSTA